MTANINYKLWAQCLVVALVTNLVGCTSMRASKISRCVTNESYHEALALLNEKGAGTSITEDAHPKLLKARHNYQQSIETKYGDLFEVKLNEGKPRAAIDLLNEGLELCPWSQELSDNKRSVELIVTKIDLSHNKWKGQEVNFDDDILVTCRFLAAIKPLCHYLNDSPELFAMHEMAKSSLLTACARYVVEAQYGQVTDEYSQIRDLLIQLAEEGIIDKSVPHIVHSVVTLPSAINENTKIPSGIYANYVSLKELCHKRNDDDIFALAKALHDKLSGWITDVYTLALPHPKAPYELITLGEGLLPVVDSVLLAHINNALADAYLNRARKWEGAGIESLLTLVFIERSEFLRGSSSTEADVSRRRALAALNQSMPLKHYLDIDIDDSVDPAFHSLLTIWVFSELTERTKDWHEWQLYKSNETENSLIVKVSDAEWIWDGIDSLNSISSSYLSHYEDVPNPMKDFYKSQLSSKKLSLTLAESSYNSAVNSHNIHPTQYSLNNVNYAKNNYINALNAYNSLVDTYNITPSTVSQPVVLPYTYQEGQLRLGWSISLNGKVNEKIFNASGISVESDTVRIGTKSTDTHVGSRRDDALDIDFSVENSLRHLDYSFAKAFSELEAGLLEFKYATSSDLSEVEENILSWILHPWGPQTSSKLDLPVWTRTVNIDEILVLDEIAAPPVIISDATAIGTDLSAEQLKESCGKFVCQILVMDDTGTSQRAHGSGTLISKDGLILTCAHVVDGSNFKIKFHEGDYSGEYDASIVYVNNKKDVALLRAEELTAQDWATVRVEAASVGGEEIIAIGNPSLADGQVNVLGVSKGIVSNPEIEISGIPQLVADINIASGSSGGPLFSTKDGAIVGVVSAVASEHITKSHGASGYTCLAAPAPRLEEWLGLKKINPAETTTNAISEHEIMANNKAIDAHD